MVKGLHYADSPQRELSVEARDKGHPSLFVVATLSVVVVMAKDIPPLVDKEHLQLSVRDFCSLKILRWHKISQRVFPSSLCQSRMGQP